MVHHTKDKGDLATIKAIADLSEKGYAIFTPLVCEHLRFDFIICLTRSNGPRPEMRKVERPSA